MVLFIIIIIIIIINWVIWVIWVIRNGVKSKTKPYIYFCVGLKGLYPPPTYPAYCSHSFTAISKPGNLYLPGLSCDLVFVIIIEGHNFLIFLQNCILLYVIQCVPCILLQYFLYSHTFCLILSPPFIFTIIFFIILVPINGYIAF